MSNPKVSIASERGGIEGWGASFALAKDKKPEGGRPLLLGAPHLRLMLVVQSHYVLLYVRLGDALSRMLTRVLPEFGTGTALS